MSCRRTALRPCVLEWFASTPCWRSISVMRSYRRLPTRYGAVLRLAPVRCIARSWRRSAAIGTRRISAITAASIVDRAVGFSSASRRGSSRGGVLSAAIVMHSAASVALPTHASRGAGCHPGRGPRVRLRRQTNDDLQGWNSIYIEPGKIHEGINKGTSPVKAIATFVIEKGKPLTSPAP